MKKLICLICVFLLLVPQAVNEELPEGFYEHESVQNAIANAVEQMRESYTPVQLEVIYQASKILHDEYFGEDTPEHSEIVEKRIPQGEYVIGELIPSGNYRFSLLDTEYDIVVLWVEKPGKLSSNYYSMTNEKPEVILHLEEGWTLRVTYTDILMSEITDL